MNLRTVAKRCLAWAPVLSVLFMQLGIANVVQVSGQKRTEGASVTIYDNGNLSTGTSSKSGVSAPGGFTWSELSTENGSNFSNTTLGAGCQLIGATTNNRCADDFIVPAGQTWTINSILTYGYQTNSVANPFVGGNLRIWNGRPGDVGSTIVFGDTATNRAGTVTDSTIFRIGNTLGGAGGVGAAATGTTRKIWQIPLNVSPALVLTAGTYWVDFQLDAGAGGSFSPLSTVVAARSLPLWNSRQFIGTTATWGDLLDIGEPVVDPQPNVVPNVVLAFPFKVVGSVSGPALSRKLDFNGDGRSDLAIARAPGPSALSSWFIGDVNGSFISHNILGLGIGYPAGEVPTPSDFDGDGKTDIAAWFVANPNESHFYWLNSSTSTIASAQFGRAGDDPTIVGDYDGDGKSDLAVFRSTPAPGFDPCGGSAAFYYRPSATPATNFNTVCWGATGDRPYPGDFDGDRKFDFVVVRDSGGSAIHYRLLSGGGSAGFQYGLTTDKFISGDFDGDGRADLCAVRTVGVNYAWYVIRSSNGTFSGVTHGLAASDVIVPGDYDGDGKTDYSVWRSGQGVDQTYYYLYRSFGPPTAVEWGNSTTTLAPPDYPVGDRISVH